jgi:acetylornithine/succinyldiaminopimelate/putrescine aminotransferase
MGAAAAWLASELVGLEPDLVCLGKALGAGCRCRACLGPPSVMDAWPRAPGEAMHTSTFLGHPLACAAALAALDACAAGERPGTGRRPSGRRSRTGSRSDFPRPAG